MKLTDLFLEQKDAVLASFKPKDHLNPELWDNKNKLKPVVRKKLLEIAQQFYKSLDVKPAIKDIIFTGSNANYNWGSTKYSDIDLHILVQYSEIDENEDFVMKYMLDKKTLWSKGHNITIYGYSVELFAQDVDQKAPFDAGVYSIQKDEWVQEPKEGIFKLNSKEVLDKVNHLYAEAKKILKSTDLSDVADIKNLKDRIQALRKDNLSSGGEFDPSNLAYKYLRRKGILDKLSELKNKIEDNKLTLK